MNYQRFSVFTFILACLLLNASPAVCAPEFNRQVIFQLEPEYVTRDHQPAENWLRDIFPPGRDGSQSAQVEKIRLPSSAADHPVLSRIFRIDLPETENPAAWINRLEAASGVMWAELAPVRFTCDIKPEGRDGIDAPPGDPFFQLQWYLDKIHAVPAWDVTRGDSTVIIAIVDVGVDYDHPDLAQNKWINFEEMNGIEGVDDDGNGFRDDIYGWDFVDDDADPRPSGRDGHGTHVAGIAAACTDNSYGMAGVSWNCRFMPVRAGMGNSIFYGYEGVIYASANGADVINLSWGSDTPSNIERITAEYAEEQGALLVAAAGNQSRGRMSSSHFPADYEGVLSVAAVSSGDTLAYFSNYNHLVDISAPGDRILSTIPDNNYAVESGTSMATPIVAGAAGLLKALHPDWLPRQIRLQLMLSSDPVDNLNPAFVDSMGYGRLNLFRAVSDDIGGFDLVAMDLNEGTGSNHNGIIEPGERVFLTVYLKNMLGKAASVTGRLITEDLYVLVDPAAHDFGVVQPGAECTNLESPLKLRIIPNTPVGKRVTCELSLSGEDILTQSFPIVIDVEPQYVTHNNGSFAFSITNFGAVGYYNYKIEQGIGEGFRFPQDGLTGLFHGSLMVGAPPIYVSDCAFGDSSAIRFDFVSLAPEFALTTGEDGIQSGRAHFTDARALNPIGVGVRQHSISFPDVPNDDYVILHYTVYNRSNFLIEGLRTALFLDWDIVQASDNICIWDGETRSGWIQHSGGGFPLFGAAILDVEPGFHVAINNYEEWDSGMWSRWSDRAKFRLMLKGFDEPENLEPADYSQLIGTNASDLSPGDSVSVTFVLAAGENVADFRSNIAAARNAWNGGIAFGKGVNHLHPRFLSITATYPEPFNGWMNIGYSVVERGAVTWKLIDDTGRIITSTSGGIVHPGDHIITFHANSLPSGRYFVRVSQPGTADIKPVTLLR